MSAEVKVLYRPYRPSNGTEGEIFEAKFCDRCMQNIPEDGCDIQMRAFWHQINEPEYPKEWIQDAEMNPRCTAFELLED